MSAGKTGTAQVYSLKGEKYAARRSTSGCATTRGSSPTRRPTSRRIALAVLVENGGFGAQAAAPVARKVFDYLPHRPGGGRPRARRAGPATSGEDESD